MSFLHPAALSLLTAALLIVLLALLRTRQLQRDVSAIFLWETLRDSSPARTQTLRKLLDPLLLLQLALFTALAVPIAEPLWTTRSPGWTHLGIIIDGSASMQARDPSGSSRYEAALREAIERAREASSSTISVIQFSSAPRVLVAAARDIERVQSLIKSSSPTGFADGDVDDFSRALAAEGGFSAFDKLLFLTDHALESLPEAVEQVTISGGTNLGITAFSLRPIAGGAGVIAFVELYNGTNEFQETRVRIDDEFSRTTVDAFLEPGETSPYLIPFPLSRGTRLTASLETTDDFPLDDVRYAALDRTTSLALRWIGKENRFLLAAIESVLPVHRCEEGEPADLTVVHDTAVAQLPAGNLLLIHAQVDGLLSIESTARAGTPISPTPDSPFLQGIEPEDLYVERLPSLTSNLPLHVLLAVDGLPWLGEASTADRTILVLVSDLYSTNLPITVDFPILIRNFIASLTRTGSSDAIDWNVVGAPVSLSRLGVTGIVDPLGQTSLLPTDQRVLFPALPGHYALITNRGEYPLAVNVASEESIVYAVPPSAPSTQAPESEPAPTDAERRVVPLWPYLVAAALLLFVAEFALYRRLLAARGGVR